MARVNLTDKEEKFIELVLEGMNLTEAYYGAGYTPAKRMYANKRAQELAKRPRIAQIIQERKEKVRDRHNLRVDLLVMRLKSIVEADPTQLVGVEKHNCRHCWGIDFKYRFTDEEFESRRLAAESGNYEMNEEGGAGFTAGRAPHPDCPNCAGHGIGVVKIADTRTLSPAEKLLYAGAEQTRSGIKVKLHNQMEALIKLLEISGAFQSELSKKKELLEIQKIEAEINAMDRQQLPIAVNINVQDASNPDRIRGEQLNVQNDQSDTEHTSE